jgi:hypothetical protein
MAFPPTEDSLSEVVDIAVVYGKATGSSNVGVKVALKPFWIVPAALRQLEGFKPLIDRPRDFQADSHRPTATGRPVNVFAWKSL